MKGVLGMAVLGLLVAGGVFWLYRDHEWEGQDAAEENAPAVGEKLDTEHGVVVYANGAKPYQSHGKHYAPSGYYYGRKWQCVEFVKRYYHDRFGHEMPDVWGHARSFFEPELAQGELNQRRGLTQYQNGQDVAPREGDLLVFVYGDYGHVAIVSRVESGALHIVQQNVAGRVREVLPMNESGGRCTVAGKIPPAGWLRLPK